VEISYRSRHRPLTFVGVRSQSDCPFLWYIKVSPVRWLILSQSTRVTNRRTASGQTYDS